MVLPAMLLLNGAVKASRVRSATSLLQFVNRAGPPARHMHTALARRVVLPRLLDTLSTTFKESSARMDGIIGHMTQELEKVCC